MRKQKINCDVTVTVESEMVSMVTKFKTERLLNRFVKHIHSLHKNELKRRRGLEPLWKDYYPDSESFRLAKNKYMETVKLKIPLKISIIHHGE